MKYVYLTDNVVTDQSQIDPFKVFYPDYASKFIEAPDEVTFEWKLVDGEWVAPPPPDYSAINKQQASALLSATDWTTIPDVADPALANPYLMNQGEFIAWRSQVRAIAVNPPTTVIADWPVEPDEQWSTQ